jgi:hypothetical protein
MHSDMKNTACTDYEILLEDSVAGDLQGAEALALAAHVRTCTNCRVALDEARVTSRLLRMMEPTPDPGAAFTHMIMTHIRTEGQAGAPREEKSLWNLMGAFARPFALTATLALGLMLAFSAYWAPQPNKTDAVVTDAHELISDPSAAPATADETLMMVAENENGKH